MPMAPKILCENISNHYLTKGNSAQQKAHMNCSTSDLSTVELKCSNSNEKRLPFRRLRGGGVCCQCLHSEASPLPISQQICLPVQQTCPPCGSYACQSVPTCGPSAFPHSPTICLTLPPLATAPSAELIRKTSEDGGTTYCDPPAPRDNTYDGKPIGLSFKSSNNSLLESLRKNIVEETSVLNDLSETPESGELCPLLGSIHSIQENILNYVFDYQRTEEELKHASGEKRSRLQAVLPLLANIIELHRNELEAKASHLKEQITSETVTSVITPQLNASRLDEQNASEENNTVITPQANAATEDRSPRTPSPTRSIPEGSPHTPKQNSPRSTSSSIGSQQENLSVQPSTAKDSVVSQRSPHSSVHTSPKLTSSPTGSQQRNLASQPRPTQDLVAWQGNPHSPISFSPRLTSSQIGSQERNVSIRPRATEDLVAWQGSPHGPIRFSPRLTSSQIGPQERNVSIRSSPARVLAPSHGSPHTSATNRSGRKNASSGVSKFPVENLSPAAPETTSKESPIGSSSAAESDPAISVFDATTSPQRQLQKSLHKSIASPVSGIENFVPYLRSSYLKDHHPPERLTESQELVNIRQSPVRIVPASNEPFERMLPDSLYEKVREAHRLREREEVIDKLPPHDLTFVGNKHSFLTLGEKLRRDAARKRNLKYRHSLETWDFNNDINEKNRIYAGFEYLAKDRRRLLEKELKRQRQEDTSQKEETENSKLSQ